MITTSRVYEKFRNPEYRKAFVAAQIEIGIPFQLRALMKARGWKQEDLASRANMLQPRISGMMTPGKTRPNIETLRRIAEAFDCGLMVRFVPFSELVRLSDEFDPESFNVPSFNDDPGFFERKGPNSDWRINPSSTTDIQLPPRLRTNNRILFVMPQKEEDGRNFLTEPLHYREEMRDAG